MKHGDTIFVVATKPNGKCMYDAHLEERRVGPFAEQSTALYVVIDNPPVPIAEAMKLNDMLLMRGVEIYVKYEPPITREECEAQAARRAARR